jgi:hypothetical protein
VSKNFEPPGSLLVEPEVQQVEVLADFINGDQARWKGQFAAETLVRYESLAAAGGLEGWEIIHKLLGDDLGVPPRSVQMRVNCKEMVRIPYDRSKLPAEKIGTHLAFTRFSPASRTSQRAA